MSVEKQGSHWIVKDRNGKTRVKTRSRELAEKMSAGNEKYTRRWAEKKRAIPRV